MKGDGQKHFSDRVDAHVRKASKADGDDVTFSRFVKVRPKARQPEQGLLLQSPKRFAPSVLRRKPTIVAGRSLFYRKGVKSPRELSNVLVSGHNNVKIGRDVRKGRLFRGYWIYTLSLEERATCADTCSHWVTCYGNHMPYAKRVDHTDKTALEMAIERDLEKLCNPVRGKRGRDFLRKGVLVRLHALGDFFDAAYVHFWLRMLGKYPNLAVYGYTARPRNSGIGQEINYGKNLFHERFAIRWSDGGEETDCTVSIKHPDEKPANAFICPEQTWKSDGCGKCGLCWNTTKNVAFLEH